MTPTAFLRSLMRDMRTHGGMGTPIEWRHVGRVCYLRSATGVFKLEFWSGGTRGTIAGLEGTYTSNEGAQDHVVFDFADHLVQDVAKAGNTDLWDRPVKAHERASGIEWYNAPPLSLNQLHEAIVTWVTTWCTRKS